MAALSMDEAHSADSRLERDLRDMAAKLDGIADRLTFLHLARQCRALAENLRDRADAVVRAWD